MSQPSVSAIVTVCNRTEFLSEAIDSILHQSYDGQIEVIVVDDGSLVPVAPAFEARFPTVRWIRQEHTGLGAARDTGARAANGELLAFQDDDDRWRLERLARQVTFLQAHPEVGAVAGDLAFLHSGRVQGATGYYRRFHRLQSAVQRRDDLDGGDRIFARRALLDSVFLDIPFFAQTLMVRREWLAKAGGWNRDIPLFTECHDLFYRLTLLGEIGFVDEILVDIRRGHDQMTGDVIKARWETNALLLEWGMRAKGRHREDICPRLARRFVRVAYQEFLRGRPDRMLTALRYAGQSALCEPLGVLRRPWRRHAPSFRAHP